jgi:tetratricopeptide (TPR) repeat protein
VVKSKDLRDEIFELIYSRNRTEEAILRLNGIIKLSPENSRAIALKAYALNKLANLRKEWKYSQVGLENANRALALNPDDDVALTSKGWALLDLGRAGEAVGVLERATSVNPGNEYAWYNLAWAQYLSGDAVGSARSIGRALAINPNNPILRRGKKMMASGKVPQHLRARGQTAKPC